MPGEYAAELERKLTRTASAEQKTSEASDRSCSPAVPVPPVPPMRRMPRSKGLAGRPKLGLSIAPIGVADRLKPGLSAGGPPSDDPDFARANEYLAKPQSSYQRMSMVLNDSTFSHKVESMDSLREGDVLVRMSKIPSDARGLSQSGHDDLVIHTAFLFAVSKSNDDFEFKRIEMREASSLYNLIGFSDKYQMALNLDETNDKKPGAFAGGVLHPCQLRRAGTDSHATHLALAGRKPRGARALRKKYPARQNRGARRLRSFRSPAARRGFRSRATTRWCLPQTRRSRSLP